MNDGNAISGLHIGARSDEGDAKPHLPIGSALCLCTVCGEHFRSPTGFDRHRTGPVEARRCLTPEEMAARGMSRNARGYWITAVYEVAR